MATVNDGNNNTAAYSYLANSPLVAQIVFATNGVTRMTTSKLYDDLNRLTEISSAPSGTGILPVTYNYAYNAANQRTQNTFSDGSHWVYQYDSLGQVTNGVRFWSDGTHVAGEDYQYQFDTIGNRTHTQTGGTTNGLSLRVANYTNNLLNQITSRDVPGTNDVIGAALVGNTVTVNGVPVVDRKAEFFHSTVGQNNQTGPVWQGVTATRAGGSVSGNIYVAQEPETFLYDADGNLSSDGRWNYTWDAENRLVSMTVNTSAGPYFQLAFAYDAKGRRIQKTVTSNNVVCVTINFLYDGWNLIDELVAGGVPLRSYVWGTDLSGKPQGAGGVGGLLEVSYNGTATTNAFVAFDGNGNVSALVNAGDGTLLAGYEYGPFGEVIRNSGSLAKNNPFRFSTKYQDDESDLDYYGYRYYKPSTGTWMSGDPSIEIGFADRFGLLDGDLIEEFSDSNPYQFVLNNPISWFDRFGLASSGGSGTGNQNSSCPCKCKSVKVTFNPSTIFGNMKMGFYAIPGGEEYGSVITIAWTVDGSDPSQCNFYLNEPPDGVSGSGPSGTISGSDGTLGANVPVSQVYEDHMGIPVRKDGKYHINVNLTQTYTCVSADGTEVTETKNYKKSSSGKYSSSKK